MSHLQNLGFSPDYFHDERRKRGVRAAISGMMRFRHHHHEARKMDATRRDLIMQRWTVIQHELIAELASEVGAMTPKLEKVIHMLEWVRIEEFVTSSGCGEGRPPHERSSKTFASLVEATASDLHAYVAQVNNRTYGDSRLRAPAVEDYLRDVVQVKGGVSDYYALGEIDYVALRKEQYRPANKPKFKPMPIGYKMSPRRKAER